jgi:sugar O-acyltransferase (sialic acid O-acetyltransferase NeuD family)
MLKLGIYGTGGFSLEVFDLIKDIYSSTNFNVDKNVFFIDDLSNNKNHLGLNIIKSSDINFEETEIIIAVGNSSIRKKIVNSLPSNVRFGTLIHPSSYISPSAKIGEDVIISHQCVVSSNVQISSHSHLNYQTCIGHETSLGKFFTSAPGVRLSGNCNIGENVYFGTNSCTVQGIDVKDNIKVGIGSVVVNNLKKQGTYMFNPSKKVF